MGSSPPLLPKNKDHAAVLLSLILDLGHRARADLAGAADMRAAAGLQIDTRDFNQAHLAHPAWRLDRHRADELGLGSGLRIGDPPRPDRVRLCNQRVEPAREHLLVEARTGHIEIEPSSAVG